MRISETHGEIPDLTLQELSEFVAPVVKISNITGVSLFGSRARGDYDRDSDYDFLISKGNIRSLLQYMSFVGELEDALNSHVDVITDTSSDDTIIRTAMQEGILLYERS